MDEFGAHRPSGRQPADPVPCPHGVWPRGKLKRVFSCLQAPPDTPVDFAYHGLLVAAAGRQHHWSKILFACAREAENLPSIASI